MMIANVFTELSTRKTSTAGHRPPPIPTVTGPVFHAFREFMLLRSFFFIVIDTAISPDVK